MRRARLLLLAVLAPVLLAGCQADVATRIDVSEQAQAALTVSARFQGDAAAAMTSDQQLVADIEALFTERGATRVQTQREDSTVTVSGVVDYEALVRSADVTGVRSAALATAEDTGTVTVTLAKPAALVKALTDQAQRSAADEADATALTETFLATTSVTVEVTFPGSATVASDPTLEPFLVVEGTQVRFSAPLAEMPSGEFVATGHLQPPRFLLWWALGAVVLGGIVAAFFMRRG